MVKLVRQKAMSETAQYYYVVEGDKVYSGSQRGVFVSSCWRLASIS